MTMPRLFFTLLLSLVGAATQAQSHPVTVTIQDDRMTDGTILLAIFRAAEGFPTQQDKAFRRIVVPIKGGIARQRLQLPAGRYAIAIVHDRNGNDKIDYNLIRVPTEGYGFSQVPDPGLQVPSFDRCAFVVPATQTLRIPLFYSPFAR